jgi:hypothetical protein
MPDNPLMEEDLPMVWFQPLSWLSRAARSGLHSRQLLIASARNRLNCEQLEERCVPANTLLVTTALDNVVTPPIGSLRAELNLAQAGDTIAFAPALSGQTVYLQGALSDLSENLTITAAGVPNVAVHGSDAFQVFHIDPGATVSIADLTIRNGAGTHGGGIYNAGTLTLIDSTVSLSTTYQTGGGGGGIFNTGTMTVTGTTIANNLTLGNGGGIFNVGTMSLTNDTLVGNQGLAGGAIANSGTMTAVNVTIAANSTLTGGAGGGIYADSISTLHLLNTLVAGNVAAQGPDIRGAVTSADYNLVGDGTGSSGIVNGMHGNLVGTTASPIDPHLGVLQNNGGLTLTRALLPTSPAVDAGSNTGAPHTDQRGFNRPVGGTTDIGAYEYQPPATTTVLLVAPNPSTVNQPVILTATVSGDAPNSNTPVGSVSFYDGASLLATVNLNSHGVANYVTDALTAGSHSLTASYGGFNLGDYHLAPSTSTLTQLMVQQGQTITTLASTPNPATVHHPVTLTAMVSPMLPGSILATGSVTFLDGSTPLATVALTPTGTATYITSTLSVGHHSLTAHFNGDANFLVSDSAARDQVIDPLSVMVIQVSSINPVTVNQSVTFSATVSPDGTDSYTPTGTVTFFGDSTVLATVPLSGNSASYATSSLSVGTHRIIARYNGDNTFGPYTTAPLTQRVRSLTIFALGAEPGRVQVRLTSNNQLLTDFAPYGPAYTGAITVAVGDVNADGYQDVVTGKATGSAEVHVYDGRAISTGTFNPANPDASLLTKFFAYAPQFNVGVNVAVGDILDNGYGDIVTGASIGNPHVKVYSGQDIATGRFNPNNPDASLLAQFFPYALQFNVGANVAVGDVSGNGYADIVTGANTGNPHVKVYSGQDIATGRFNSNNADASLLAQFFPYALQFDVGANVAVGNTTGDGYADIITGASIGNPHVKVYSGQDIATGRFNTSNPEASRLDQFFAYDLQYNIGVTVGAADFGQGRAAILTGASSGNPHYRVVAANSSGVKPPALNGMEGIPSDLRGGVCVGA